MSRLAVDPRPALELGEWESGYLRGVSLTPRDQRLAERLRSRPRDTRVDVQTLDGGLRVSAGGAVGVVRFDQFEVRIEPKLPGGHLQLFRMVEFATGVSGIAEMAGSPRMRFAQPYLVDLVVQLLAAFTERLIKGGLRADYVTHEGDLPALRGRLLPDQQVLNRFGLYDRLVCRYDEHEQDVPDNQLLARALDRGARVAIDARVKRHARELAAVLEDVCDPRALDISRGPDAIAYDRMNAHYRDAHYLAWMVLWATGPDEDLGVSDAHVRSFLIDMNAVFERFLERALREILGDEPIRIHAQRADSIVWDVDRERRYARIRPDFVLERMDQPRARLPVDAKYKRYGMDDKRAHISVDDLTQAFLYAYAYRDPQQEVPPPAVVIYPSERAGDPKLVRLEVRSVEDRAVDARLFGLGIHIPSALDELDGKTPPTTGDAVRSLVTTELAMGSPTSSVVGGALA